MKHIRMSKGAWDRIIIWAVMALFLVHGLTVPIGRLEGRMLPVVAEGRITDTAEEGYQTVFSGRAVKLRSCRLLDVRWYLVADDGIRVPVPLAMLERRRPQPLGAYGFGPWAMPIAPAELLHQTLGEVWHQCHPGWPTISRFFDGRRDPVPPA